MPTDGLGAGALGRHTDFKTKQKPQTLPLTKHHLVIAGNLLVKRSEVKLKNIWGFQGGGWQPCGMTLADKCAYSTKHTIQEGLKCQVPGVQMTLTQTRGIVISIPSCFCEYLRFYLRQR